MKKLTQFILLYSLFATGCRVSPPYEPPCVPIPEGWKTLPDTALVPIVDEWWEVFNDDLLNSLEQEVIENNHDLFRALERVAEARALAGIEGANLFPQISLDPSFTQTGLLFKIFLPSAVDNPAFANIPPVFRVHQRQY